MMLMCEALFGRARGGEVRDLVERLVDGPCPCKAGVACPLADANEGDDVIGAGPADGVLNTR